MRLNIFHTLSFLLSILLASCDITSYETGEGDLSNMRADYVDITVSQGMVTGIVTDNDESLVVPPGFAYSEKKDTMVRRLLYYSKGADGQPIQMIGQKTVSMIIPLMWIGQDDARTDPLTLTALWMSGNKHYLNMQLGIKVGSSEAEASQSVVLRCDSVSTYDKGAMWVTLCHDQGGMPEYYTREVLLSIPANLLPDTIHLDANTYSGKKTFTIVK